MYLSELINELSTLLARQGNVAVKKCEYELDHADVRPKEKTADEMDDYS